MTAASSRGAQRRDEVLDAALRVMARDGLRAVTHRSVAAEAGGSVRATTYYFASIDALIEAAFVRYVERSLARFAEVEAAIPARGVTPQAAAAGLAAIVVGDVELDRDGLIAEFQFALEAARRPDLAATYGRWQDALERTLRAYAVALGSAEPALHARVVLATLRGLELEALARPGETLDAAGIEQAFAAVLGGLRG